uniref:JmjC domain-containing protein n=1 Tax=Plectus sambesii TaxID=2011161 RepID=A0A914XLH6_9BILA
MKLDKFDLRLDRDGAMYLAGEEVSGTLYVNTSRAVTLSKIGVKLTGIVHTGWVNKTSDVVYESNDEIVHDYMDATNYLADVSDGELLPEGEHFIKFHFKLSMDIVASMHNDYFGWVRYTCSGLLAISDNTCFRLGGNNEIVVDKSITVYSVLNLDAPHFRLPSTASDSVELVGCCRRHGSLSAKVKLVDFIIPVGLPPTSTKANGLITISYFFKLDMDDFELVIPVGEEMVETAAVAASAYANECGVCFPGLSSKLDAQATASGSSSSVANNADADSSKEIDHFWIQCDVCITWFHGKCVDVEEYESAVIDQYHCPTCQLQHGSSVWKAERNHHRYVFDDLTQDDLPTQIGTRCFIDDFKQNQDRFPLASDKQLIRLDSGYDFVSHFNERQEWMKPYLITHAEGLGLRMPGDDFSVEDCVGLMGADRAVDTIDVYKQHTYQMSLGRYLKKWHDVDRPRLYNILSLEFSHSKLCEVVGPPSIVPKLSWVHQFWPAGKADATTPTTLATLLHAGDVHVEHLRAKPEVALFCLIGMRDSYTDFHIDFGGSSVWYHVFKGAKVFYVVEPTHANLALFGEYQKNPKRSEIFFGDLLPPGAVTRVVVEQGRTLLIPSGWIHAVWTPEDSLVFGGNFLHSLNIPMQLRIYEMELDCHTDERFMFPSFELTNWYAARSVLESLKGTNWLYSGTTTPNYGAEENECQPNGTRAALVKWCK